MRLFCSNAYTGQDINEVTNRMQLVVDALDSAEHDPYCPIFDPYKIELQSAGDIPAIFTYAFENLKTCDGMVAIVVSEKRSEGQLMEIGALLAAKKPLYLFMKDSVNEDSSHLPRLARQKIVWSDEDDLHTKLQECQF